MPTAIPAAPQLDLLPGVSPAYGDAIARYETLRPILQGQRILIQQSHATGLWRADKQQSVPRLTHSCSLGLRGSGRRFCTPLCASPAWAAWGSTTRQGVKRALQGGHDRRDNSHSVSSRLPSTV